MYIDDEDNDDDVDDDNLNDKKTNKIDKKRKKAIVDYKSAIRNIGSKAVTTSSSISCFGKPLTTDKVLVNEIEYSSTDNWLIEDMKKQTSSRGIKNKRKYSSHDDENFQSDEDEISHNFKEIVERSKNETNAKTKSTGNNLNDFDNIDIVDTEEVLLDDNEKKNFSSVRGQKKLSKKRILDTETEFNDIISIDKSSNFENRKNYDISKENLASSK